MRKPLTQVRSRISNEDYTSERIKLLLKRICTFEEAMDYLIYVIPTNQLDDMLGELTYWDNHRDEFRRIREEINKMDGEE
jgi:hypothetical protein